MVSDSYPCALSTIFPKPEQGTLTLCRKSMSTPMKKKALADLTEHLPFGASIVELIEEFNECKTREAKLAHDADQLAFIIDLKAKKDLGATSPLKWLPHVINRLKTDTGKKIAEEISRTEWDEWWLKNFIDG